MTGGPWPASPAPCLVIYAIILGPPQFPTAAAAHLLIASVLGAPAANP